jgi:hypothetical protein
MLSHRPFAHECNKVGETCSFYKLLSFPKNAVTSRACHTMSLAILLPYFVTSFMMFQVLSAGTSGVLTAVNDYHRVLAVLDSLLDFSNKASFITWVIGWKRGL